MNATLSTVKSDPLPWRPWSGMTPDRARHGGSRQSGRPSEGEGSRSALPPISPTLLRWFRWYGRRYVARHFHTVRLAGTFAGQDDLPLVLYSNHASWWDPMMAQVLADEVLPDRRHYAPVDREAIERYKFFKRLGFFGVEQHHLRGAREFLWTSRAILETPGSALWITPQGRFADVRERPPGFQRGVGVLASRCRVGVFIPVALEYTFWEERLPEALIWVGQPTLVEGTGRSDAKRLSRLLEQNLINAQDDLAQAAIRRDTSRFVTVLRGRAGVNGLYDGWRSLAARLRGQRFRREHGKL